MKIPSKIDLSIIKKYDTILASMFVIIAVIFLSFLYLYPNFQKAQEIFSQQKNLRTKLTVLRKKYDLLTSLDNNLFQTNIAKLNNTLPESKDYVSLFETLDNLQSQANVVITRTDLQLGIVSTSSANLKKTTTSLAYDVPISVEVIGSLAEVNTFIKSLSNLSGRIMTLKSIQWSKTGEDSLQVLLKGYAYFYPIPAKLGSVDTALPELDKDKEDLLKKVDEVIVYTSEESESGSVDIGKTNLFE